MSVNVENMSIVYQDWQDQTSWYKHSGDRDTFELVYLALGMTGESGEAGDAVKKLIRLHGDKAWEYATTEQRIKFVHEVGDALWYIVRTCTFLGINVEDLMLINMVKLYDRMQERSEHGLGRIEWPLGDPDEARQEAYQLLMKICDVEVRT